MLPRRRRAGDTTWVYFICYGSARFVNEFFRADNPRLAALGGLTIFQALCIATVLFGFVMLAKSLALPSEPIPAHWEPAKEQA